MREKRNNRGKSLEDINRKKGTWKNKPVIGFQDKSISMKQDIQKSQIQIIEEMHMENRLKTQHKIQDVDEYYLQKDPIKCLFSKIDADHLINKK